MYAYSRFQMHAEETISGENPVNGLFSLNLNYIDFTKPGLGLSAPCS